VKYAEVPVLRLRKAFWLAAVGGLCYPFVIGFILQWRVFIFFFLSPF
jgi:hypothetical protein